MPDDHVPAHVAAIRGHFLTQFTSEMSVFARNIHRSKIILNFLGRVHVIICNFNITISFAVEMCFKNFDLLIDRELIIFGIFFGYRSNELQLHF